MYILSNNCKMNKIKDINEEDNNSQGSNNSNNRITSCKISHGNFYEAPENKQSLFSW